MARLPRYRRLGVEAARPAQLDFANLREQQRLAQTVSQQVDQMGDFVYRRASERAARQGVEAVEEQGARPILERIEAAGGPTTIPEQAAFEAANRIAVAEIQMEADQQIAQLLQTAQQNMTPFSEVQTQLSDVVDGYAATLSTLDPQAAGLLRVRLQENTGRANTRYASWYQGRMRAAAAERRATAAEGYAATAMELARTPGVGIQQIYDQLQLDRQTLIDGGESESRADRWFNSVYGTAVREHGLATAVNMSEEELAAVSLEPPTENLPGLSLTETFTEWRAQQSVINSRRAVYETEAAELGRTIVNSYDILGEGGTIGPEAEAQMLEAAERLELFSPGITADVQNLISDRDYMQFTAIAPLTTLQAELDQVEAGLPGQGEAGIDTSREATRAGLLRNLIQHRLAVLEAGQGLAYAAEHGVTYGHTAMDREVVGAPIDFFGENATAETIRASISRRFAELEFIERENGFGGQNVLLPQEIAQLSQALINGEPGERLAILGTLNQVMDPQQMVRVFSDLDMNVPAIRITAQIASLTEQNPEAATYAIAGQSFEDVIGLTSANTRSISADVLGAAFTDLPTTRTAITEVADLIYRGMAAQDPDIAGAWNQGAYRDALEMAMGSLSIHNINGGNVVLPPDVNVDAIRDYLRRPFEDSAILVDPEQQVDWEVISRDNWYPQARRPSEPGGQPSYVLVQGSGTDMVVWTDENDVPVLVSPAEMAAAYGRGDPEIRAAVASFEEMLEAAERSPTITSAEVNDLLRQFRGLPFSQELYGRIETLQQRAEGANEQPGGA